MIILASNSTRRIDLLKDAGFNFEVIPSNIEENIKKELKPFENAMGLSREKALDVFSRNPDKIILAADTIVAYKNEIFGKPKDREDAFRMLKTLSNKTHDVITGVTIINNDNVDTFYSKSSVTFNELSDDDILSYINTGEPIGKAGSYAIQGLGKNLIKTFNGDFFTIVGLPLKQVVDKLNLILSDK
jgi:septum formation protein